LLRAGANPRYLTDVGESVFDALDESPNEREDILAVLAEYGVIPDAS
jgi:hypothetical protein